MVSYNDPPTLFIPLPLLTGDWTTVLIVNLDANVTGIFTSIFVLCAPSKFVYASCAVLYAVTGLLDMILVAAW